MSIKQVLVKYHHIEIDLLLAHLLGKSKEFLYLNGENRLTRIQAIRLTRMVKRRLRVEPVAYILGYKDFYGLRFKVNRHVLIPRPETEWVIDKTIERLKDLKLKDFKRPIRILDVGTGSGCIIISLAKVLGQRAKGLGLNYRFYASDISQAALKVAKQNAKTHGVNIKFIHSDILENVSMKFDVIIANLPYGWSQWKNNCSMETEGLKFEPKGALFAKEKGLMIIRRLLEQIAGLRQKPKLVYLEFDPRQKLLLAKLIKKSLPGSKVKFYKDYGNLWRYVEISLS